jgi:hypothetical protein
LSWTDAGGNGTLTLSNDAIWSDLRSGSIVTFTGMNAVDGGYNTDTSYNPVGGDWWLNVFAGDAQYVTASSSVSGDGAFSTSHNNWQLTIKNASSVTQFGPAGEGVSPASGIGSDEVFKLETDPSASIAANSPSYTDGSSSTFGQPNIWSGGAFTQDFSALRSAVPEPTTALLMLAGLAAVRRRRIGL